MKANGQERFDGFDVSVYDGKFTGGFDLEEDLAQKIGFDDVVTFVVTGRVGVVGITETKLGDLKRTNTFQVTHAAPLQPKQAETLLNSLGESVNGVNAGQMTLDDVKDVNNGEVTDVNSVPSIVGKGAEVLDGEPVTDPVLAEFLTD